MAREPWAGPGRSGHTKTRLAAWLPSEGPAGLGGEGLKQKLRQKSGYYLPLPAAWH